MVDLPPVAILAGGLATRLHPITETIPKALVEVAGKPFIVRQLELLRAHGITRFVLCVGHLGAMIRETLGDGRAYGVEIQYSFDGETLLGTGGALRKAIPLLGECAFILYGDSYLRCDYSQVYARFRESGKPALMTVFHNAKQWDTSNVLFRDGRIRVYDKRHLTPEMQHIDYGLGVINTAALLTYPADRPFDLADVYSELARRDDLAGYEVSERFYEIGSHRGLEELRALLTDNDDMRGTATP